jgi:hypothetical protein
MGKRIQVAIMFLVLSTAAFGESDRDRYGRIKALVDEQTVQLEELRGKLSWTWNELQTAQTQVTAVAGERDHWKEYGEDRDAKWMDAERRVAKGQKRIYFDNMIFIGIAGLFIIWKLKGLSFL